MTDLEKAIQINQATLHIVSALASGLQKQLGFDVDAFIKEVDAGADQKESQGDQYGAELLRLNAGYLRKTIAGAQRI